MATKFGKKVGNEVKATVNKGVLYFWRVAFVLAIILGIFLIGLPVKSLIKTKRDIRELEEKKTQYQESIRNDSSFVENIKNREFLEQYAREEYGMHGKNEKVFRIE